MGTASQIRPGDEGRRGLVRKSDVRRARPGDNGSVQRLAGPLNRPALGTVLVAAVAALVFGAGLGPDSVGERAAISALGAVQLISLWWMCAHAERAMAVSLAAGIGLLALWPQLGMLGLANVSLCMLAIMRPPRVSLWALGAMVALAAWPVATRGPLAGVIAAGGPVLSWSWGELVRTRRDRRWGEARRAVAEERMRIARELHDVVAHTVSLIVVQAVAADDVFEARPDQARESLRAIESSGRAALAELRRLVGAMRPDEEPGERDPQPGLGQLQQLAGSVRAAGLEVAVRYEGEPVEVPAGVDLSAYRIVQEALTNTLRHARAHRAAVIVRYTPTKLELEISDDGRGMSGPVDGGHGIVGMRERATLLGGSLELGRGPLGGLCVRAAVPMDGAAR
jgi:signal transduction histidine kinase